MREAGLNVPDDVSVVGVDDLDLAAAIEPGLTTVPVPHRRMGQEAARLIIKMVRNEAASNGTAISTMIVERESLRNLS